MLMQEEKVDLKKKNPEVKEPEVEMNNSEIREFDSLPEPEQEEIKDKIEHWGENSNNSLQYQPTEQLKEIDLEKELEQHKLDIERIKFDGQKAREKREIHNSEQLENIEADMKLKEAIREQKAKFPHPVTSRIWGLIFILTAIIGTIASTVITLCSGWEVYEAKEMTKFAFLSAIVIIQGSIFIFNCMRTKILTQFPNYGMIFHIITKSLLLVSIYFNFLFFTVQYDDGWIQQMIILLSCIMLDFIAVYSTSLGMDLFTLNMYARSQTKGLVEMVWFNMTSKFRNRQLEKYNENVLDYNEIARKTSKSKHKEYLNEKPDDVKVEVVEEDPEEEIEFEKEETTNQPVEEKEVEKEDPEEEIEFEKSTKNEKLNYLKYIIKNRKSSGLIPSNTKVLNAYKDKKTINLNGGKINAIREELYNKNVLERPINGGKNGSPPTYFTEEFLEKIEDFDGKTLPQISERYENLDKEKVNNLGKKVDEIPAENNENSEKKIKEKVDENPIENDENFEEKTIEKKVS